MRTPRIGRLPRRYVPVRSRILTGLGAVLVATATLVPVPAGAKAPDTAYLDESFEQGTDVFSRGAWGMEPLADGHVGAGLRSIIPAGEHWGSSGHWYFTDHGLSEPDELYWRYWLRFPPGFHIEPPNRGKLPGVGGLYTYNCLGGRPSTPAEPCFSARMLFSRDYSKADGSGYQDGPDDKTVIGFYVYHLDSPSNRGDIWTWDESVATLDHGPWYCVEGRIRMNTPGVHDGILQGWVDGVQAFDRSDIAFRRADEDWIHVKSFWFDVYYGGDAAVTSDEIQFDSLAFGPERIGCDDSFTFDGSFWDDDGSVFETDIEWLAAAGVTKGCNPPTNDRFCPDDPVTRGQMAAFLVRALGLSPPSGTNTFGDDDGSTFEADIEALAAAGITRGCNPPANDRFCPDDPVTRGQMAAFLVRAYGYPAAPATGFTDTAGSPFVADIDRLAAAGVTKGCNPPANDRFCPDDPVTRGQMAAFLHRAGG